jgi:hypothetical protein
LSGRPKATLSKILIEKGVGLLEDEEDVPGAILGGGA